MPYLSHVHFNPRSYATAFDRAAAAAQKTARVSMVFSTDCSVSFRPILLQQCSARPEHCLMRQMSASSMQSQVHEHAGLYSSSWFCVMPAGDTPTRMAIYECAALGAVPVVFETPALLDILPFSDLLDWGALLHVLLGVEHVLDGTLHVVDDLLGVSEDAYMAKLEHVHRHAHLQQYSSHPSHWLVRSDQLQILHPRNDAFTAAVKAVFRNVCRRGLLDPGRCH